VSVSSADRVVPSRQPEYSTVRKDRPTVTTEAFVYDAIRTPRGRGKKTGSLHATKPVSLVVGLIDELQKRNPGLDPERISEIVLGVVTPVGSRARTSRAPPRWWRACPTAWPGYSSTGSAPPAWRR
jgi:hypothetical protein